MKSPIPMPSKARETGQLSQPIKPWRVIGMKTTPAMRQARAIDFLCIDPVPGEVI
jgi:hypothetical protein